MIAITFPLFVASNNLSDDSTTQQEETEKPKKRKKKKPSPKTSDTSLRDQLADSHSSLRDYFPDPALRNYLQGLYVSKLHHTYFEHITFFLANIEILLVQNYIKYLESMLHLPL